MAPVPGSGVCGCARCALSCAGRKATSSSTPQGKSAKPGRLRAANGPGERRDCSGIPISVSIAARGCSRGLCTTQSIVAPCGWSWCDKAKGANPGICSPMNPSRRRSKPGTSPSPTFGACKSRKVSGFRKPNSRSNPSDFRTGSRGAKCCCWSLWPMDFCSGCSLHRCGLPVPSCCFIGARLADWRLWRAKVPVYRLRWALASALANASPTLFGRASLSSALSHHLARLLFTLVDHSLAPVRMFVLKLCSGSCYILLSPTHLPPRQEDRKGSLLFRSLHNSDCYLFHLFHLFHLYRKKWHQDFLGQHLENNRHKKWLPATSI